MFDSINIAQNLSNKLTFDITSCNTAICDQLALYFANIYGIPMELNGAVLSQIMYVCLFIIEFSPETNGRT